MEQGKDGKLTIDISGILSIGEQPDHEPTKEGATPELVGAPEATPQGTVDGGVPTSSPVDREVAVNLSEDSDRPEGEEATESGSAGAMSFTSVGSGAASGARSQGSGQHLPKPPKVASGEKVDTSKLDEALKKRQPGSGAAQGSVQNEHLTEEQEGWDMSEDGNTGELPEDEVLASEEAELSEDSEIEDTEAGDEDTSEELEDEEDTEEEEDEASDSEDEDEESSEDEETSKEEETSEESDEEESAEDEEATETSEDEASEEDDDTEDDEDEVEAKKETHTEGPDPDFAENLTKTASDDTVAPQTEAPTTQYVEAIEADQIHYKEPAITELHKHPILEKRTNGESALSVDRMPIELTFETGRSKITIGELERIKEGYTFECANPVNTPVIIRANDTPIGTGELLDVDGRIGVRVIEFYNK